MMAFINNRCLGMLKLNKPYWQARLDIHLGSDVAGVVGSKKFTFDIWGVTIINANRIESNGEPGKMNISKQVFERIRSKSLCTYRGEIDAKGKVKMCFLE